MNNALKMQYWRCFEWIEIDNVNTFWFIESSCRKVENERKLLAADLRKFLRREYLSPVTPSSEMTPIHCVHRGDMKGPCEKKRRHRATRRLFMHAWEARAVRACKCTRIADLPRLIFVNINYGAHFFSNLVRKSTEFLHFSRDAFRQITLTSRKCNKKRASDKYYIALNK